MGAFGFFETAAATATTTTTTTTTTATATATATTATNYSDSYSNPLSLTVPKIPTRDKKSDTQNP